MAKFFVLIAAMAIVFLFGWIASQTYQLYTDGLSEDEFIRLNRRRVIILDSLPPDTIHIKKQEHDIP